MSETITLQALDLSGETLTMFLRKSDGTLLNTGGDAMTESGSTGVFTATLAEARTGLGPLAVRICSGSETADNLLYDGFLAEGTTVIDSVMRAELDSAVQTQIDNVENASGYILAVLAGACADPQTASETYAITVFGSTFTVDMAGQTSTGTRTAPTLTKT
jgi:hypothetical protein